MERKENEVRVLTYQQYYNMRPDEFKPGDVIQANLVLVVGHGGDMAVYVAPDASWDAEMVAQAGDKIVPGRGEKVAEGLFPSVAHERHYRR